MGTRNGRLAWLLWTLGVALCVLPAAGAAWLALLQGRQQAAEHLRLLAGDVLRREADARMQVNEALRDLAARGDAAPCAPDSLAAMRRIAAIAGYLQGLGHVEDGVLRCSSLETHRPVLLGPPDRMYEDDGGHLVAWDGIALPGVPGGRFSVVARGGDAAILVPAVVLGTHAEPGIAIGLAGRASHRVLYSVGDFYEAWLREPGGAPFTDAWGSLVVAVPAPAGGTVVVAGMPAGRVKGFVRDAVGRYLPLGLGVGALLALATWLVGRYLLSLKAQLREALRRRQFSMLYQPVVDLRDGRCVGAEALIRWTNNDGKPVSPVVFIPAAEEHGLILELTAQVIAMVERDTGELMRAYPEVHIAINFSAEDLHSASTERRLVELLHNTGARSSNILIEATERGLMVPEKAQKTLAAVRGRGFKIAIDDFGTGNSSLSYLATYELDYLKIDKAFVDAIEQQAPTARMAFHIIDIARSLGLETIAEGVETENQRDILRRAGVQYAQGWLFGKPMPIGQLAGMMRREEEAATG